MVIIDVSDAMMMMIGTSSEHGVFEFCEAVYSVVFIACRLGFWRIRFKSSPVKANVVVVEIDDNDSDRIRRNLFLFEC